MKPGNKGHTIRCGKRKVNAQYGFKIVTYTEGNKMGTGNVLSLCCYNKSPKSPTQTIPILNIISNLS